jgi:hypothetical protein
MQPLPETQESWLAIDGDTDLQPHEHTGLPIACVAVVEQRDVPAHTHHIQEMDKRPWALWEDDL